MKTSAMGIFQFKKFNVVNERSAMKVNTDGVLLGAVMHISPEDSSLLDIGTGTGTIALMAAQRLAALYGDSHVIDVSQNDNCVTDVPKIDNCITDVPQNNMFKVEAIDIDEPSATEAAHNFANSPWADHLKAYNLSLDKYAESLPEGKRFDLIFSNPPYFEDSLTAPDQRKSTARHTSDGLSYRDIFNFAVQRLSDDGRVAFVLPSDQELCLCRYARMSGLYLSRITRVRTVPRKSPSRMIAEFTRRRNENPEDMTLTIQSEGTYTQEYLNVMKDFYLFA